LYAIFPVLLVYLTDQTKLATTSSWALDQHQSRAFFLPARRI